MAKAVTAKKADKSPLRRSSGLYDVHPGVAMMQVDQRAERENWTRRRRMG